jgi:hypothetical protein
MSTLTRWLPPRNTSTDFAQGFTVPESELARATARRCVVPPHRSRTRSSLAFCRELGATPTCPLRRLAWSPGATTRRSYSFVDWPCAAAGGSGRDAKPIVVAWKDKRNDPGLKQPRPFRQDGSSSSGGWGAIWQPGNGCTGDRCCTRRFKFNVTRRPLRPLQLTASSLMINHIDAHRSTNPNLYCPELARMMKRAEALVARTAVGRPLCGDNRLELHQRGGNTDVVSSPTLSSTLVVSYSLGICRLVHFAERSAFSTKVRYC